MTTGGRKKSRLAFVVADFCGVVVSFFNFVVRVDPHPKDLWVSVIVLCVRDGGGSSSGYNNDNSRPSRVLRKFTDDLIWEAASRRVL